MPNFKLHREKPLDEERAKRRIHNIVPWIENPLRGVDKEHLVFAPREEASTLELFFDLFFVANLATFTAYHSVTDHSSLFSYVGFFVIIWTTWYHVTLHDVRFAHDTIYERACKTTQMISFVGFSLVGSAFDPGTGDGNNTNFRILCYVLVLVHALLFVQYAVVLFFVMRSKLTKVLLPLMLNMGVYLVATLVFVFMTPAFKEGKIVDANSPIFSVWWVVLLLETVATVAISCIWRILSFKKTHLVERMGLLTLIVIGEGAIGVTKTISKMMGKYGLDPKSTSIVLCIILILVAIWMIYFDNHPHGHYGTIRQQFWSTLHFPLHLSIVGVVEGAQQLALARYMLYTLRKYGAKMVEICVDEQLDAQDLADKLTEASDYFQLYKKLESLPWYQNVTGLITEAGRESGICTNVEAADITELPEKLQEIFATTAAGFYATLGVKLDPEANPLDTALESWKIVYRYFWSATVMLLGCFIICMLLIRRNRVDFFDISSLLNRGVVFVTGAVFLGLSGSESVMYSLLETPFLLPTLVLLLYFIIITDRVAAWIANRRNRKSGQPLIEKKDNHGTHDETDHEAYGSDTQALIGGRVGEAKHLPPPPESASSPPRPLPPHQPVAQHEFVGAAMMPGYPESFQYGAGPAPHTTRLSDGTASQILDSYTYVDNSQATHAGYPQQYPQQYQATNVYRPYSGAM